jgi:protein-ribulosamine 3-kinase
MITGQKFMGGSNWSSAYVYQTSSGQSFFVKTASGRSASEMFEGEALGLRAMGATRTVRIPEVFHYGELPGRGNNGSFIVMEYLYMKGAVDPSELGRQLALMHLAEPSDPNAQAGKFGFAVDNTIGGTAQPNSWCHNWIDFFRERRLRHQLKLANDANLSRLGDTLCSKMHKLFDGIEGEIKPSVLHGDLWSGNIAAVDDGGGGAARACIFDPATYYGHHEAEFGMSWCAGFSGSFWTAYYSVIPKAKGWDDRHDLYQLYHYLNHYNLFGGSYYNQCAHIMERLNKKL